MLKKSLMGAVAAVTLFAAGSANAVVFTFSGDVDPTAGTLNASASANVSITGSTLDLLLTNTTANQFTAGQLLTGLTLYFDIDPTGVSGLTQDGSLVSVVGNTTSPIAGSPTHWTASLLSGNVFLTTIGNAQPINGVLSTSLRQSPAPNGSLQSTTSQFDPFINGTGTFSFNLAGLSPNATVTGVQFNFGTHVGEGVGCGGVCGGGGGGNPVPEPATWALMIAGFGGVGAMIRRRRTVVAQDNPSI